MLLDDDGAADGIEGGGVAARSQMGSVRVIALVFSVVPGHKLTTGPVGFSAELVAGTGGERVVDDGGQRGRLAGAGVHGKLLVPRRYGVGQSIVVCAGGGRVPQAARSGASLTPTWT